MTDRMHRMDRAEGSIQKSWRVVRVDAKIQYYCCRPSDVAKKRKQKQQLILFSMHANMSSTIHKAALMLEFLHTLLQREQSLIDDDARFLILHTGCCIISLLITHCQMAGWSFTSIYYSTPVSVLTGSTATPLNQFGLINNVFVARLSSLSVL